MVRPRLRVLVIDDDREDAELVADLLEDAATTWEPELTWVSSYEDGMEALTGGSFDVCLLDYQLGAETGLDFLREPRVAASGVPVILLTGIGGGEVDVQAWEAGAADYLDKQDLTGVWLERSIRYAVEWRHRRAAETHLGAVLRNSREIVAVFAPDGELVYASPSVVRILGFDPEKRQGHHAFEEVHPDDVPGVEEAFGEVLDDPTRVVALQARVRDAQGSWRTLDAVLENHIDNPDIRGVLASAWDVTERVEHERRIRLQADLLDAVGQALITTDRDGIVTYLNPVAERLYGWSAEEALGRDVVDITVPEPSRKQAEEIMQALGRGESWSGEFTVRRADGSRFPALVTNAPILDDEGNVTGVIGVSSDITQLKETEAALRERVKELRTLYTATEVLRRQDMPLKQRLQAVVEAIPPGWQYPEVTEARLTLEDSAVETPGFRETEWMQSVAIVSEGSASGRLEVALTEPRPESDEGPFLNEERDLLETLATAVSNALEHHRLERYLSLIFENLSEGVFVVDPSRPGRPIVMVNPTVERMFGFTAEEMLGRSVEMIHVDHEAFVRFAEEYRPVLRRGEVFHGSQLLRRKDGSVFEAEQTLTLLEPDKGVAGPVLGVVRDISETARAARELRRSEERFRQIAEHIQDVFWVTTPDKQRMEYISPAFLDIWGREPDELYRDAFSWTDHIHPEDRERVRHAALRQAEGGYEEEYRIIRTDGAIRWIHDRAFPVRNPEGEVERIIGVAEDITERKNAEARFTALIREISDVIFIIDAAGRVTFASPSVEQVSGYTPAEFEQMNAFDLIHSEDRAEARSTLATLLENPGQTVRTQYRIRTKDGEIRHMESVVRNLLEERAVGGVLITSRDVTERFELEERLRVTQRIESIGRLAGGIAHDFNNLLTVIRSQSDLLLMDLGEDHALASEIEIVQEVADRAAALTSQLLAFSREQVLRPRTLDLADVVRRVGPLIERMIGERITVSYDLARDLPPVKVDPVQLEQALTNLAVNAKDAMPDGGELTVSVDAESLSASQAAPLPGLEAGRYAVVRVRDNGIGMNEETRARIFEPFFTTKGRGEGTGLGLAMVYGFVKQSGGAILVESARGKGTTFELWFPESEGQAEALGGARPRPAESATLSGSVLVIEDDPHVRRVTRRVLEHAGFTVAEAGDAETALEMLHGAIAADLVMTDLVLPGLGGRDVIARVAELRPGLPVLVTSGYAADSPGHPGDLPEWIPFIQKPFTPEGLVEAVRSAMERRGLQAE